MKPYPEYKASGIDWLGEIPSHWKVSKYKYHAESRMGITILREQMVEEGLPIYSATQDDSILGYTHDRSLVLHRADFVIPARGNSIGNVSKVSFDEATCTQTTICSTNFHNISVDFLLYCCKGFKLKWFFFDDTAIPQITVSQVDNNVLPLPSINEQEAIAGYLDEVTGKIDALISGKTVQVEELRTYRSSLITETVTRGLNPDAPLRDSGIDWLGSIPQHWENFRLGLLFNAKAGGDAKPNLYSDTKDSFHPYPVYTNSLVESQIYAYSSEPIFTEDAITVTGRGDIGHAFCRKGGFDAIIRLLVLTPYKKLVLKYFMYFIDTVIPFFTDSAAVGQLSAQQISKYILAVPPLSEQQEIADFLDKKTAKIDRLVEELTKQLDELAEYKQAVITEAVTGKVDVRDYKPNI